MLRNMILLMTAVVIGFFFADLLWAETNDALPPAKTLSMPEEAASPSSLSPAIAPDAEGYLIGPGDVLDIAVWKDEALTRSCVVRPDGFISFPLIGDIRAAGRTMPQLKAEMEKRLIRYVPEVTLFLDIKQINSLIIYVIGKVNNPGRFILNVDTNVIQALATAGGLTIFANRNKIRILRQPSNETTVYPFEYDEVISGKRLEQNITLRRGDVVVVP